MKKTIFTLLCLLLCALVIPVKANSQRFVVSGGMLVPLAETDISVKKEILTITFKNCGKRTDAYIDVYYEFWNPTNDPKTILMGFVTPPCPTNHERMWIEDRDSIPWISNFTVELNQEKLSYKYAPCELFGKELTEITYATEEYSVDYYDPVDEAYFTVTSEGYIEDSVIKVRVIGTPPAAAITDQGKNHTYVYYFTATFNPGLNIVHHTYKSGIGYGSDVDRHFEYELTPACAWANHQIDDFTLVLKSDKLNAMIMASDIFPDNSFSIKQKEGKVFNFKNNVPTGYDEAVFTSGVGVVLNGGTAELHLENFAPKKELIIDIVVGLKSNYYYNEDSDEGLMSYYDYESCYENWAKSLTAYGLLQRGYYFTPLSTLSLGKKAYGLWNKSDEETKKRILRNFKYAQMGHPFKDKKLREFFECFWWYLPAGNEEN